MSEADSNEASSFEADNSIEAVTADGLSVVSDEENDNEEEEVNDEDSRNGEKRSSQIKENDVLSHLDNIESDSSSKGVLEQDPLLDISFLQENAVSHNEDDKHNKREEGLGIIRDELDFEEDKDSAEEEGEELEEGEADSKKDEPVNREEGEVSDEDEGETLLCQEPKPVCRFFNKGQCTWGANCRFIHPGVSDKGNYNMFAPPKPTAQAEASDNTAEKEKPKEMRQHIVESNTFETAWERGLRYAKEMKKRANKRKETDADFEEKRFNLSLGQAELDRENDYYTRPASPVYKPSDEVIDYLDPYEKQAIRHFRGGHFENLEVRYNVDPAYRNRGSGHMRSRRDKFEREVTERIPRRMRVPQPVPEENSTKIVKEKRYPKPRVYKEERYPDTKTEAEVWADPWARRNAPANRIQKKKIIRTRSYSSGSSSRSSRSSRSSSNSKSSYSRSRSRSQSSRSSRSRSYRSSSRSHSITPPIHPRQREMNRGRGRGGRGGRGGERGGRPAGGFEKQYQNQRPNQHQYPSQQMNQYPNQYPNQNPHFNQAPNYPPNHPLAPAVQPNRISGPRRMNPNQKDGRVPLIQLKVEPDRKYPQEERMNRPAPLSQDPRQPEPRERPVAVQRKIDLRPPKPDPHERVDMFGRTIRKDVPRSPSLRSPSRSPGRTHVRRKFSASPSRSKSGSSRSHSSSASSRSHSGSRSRSGSVIGSRSRSRSGSRSESSSSSIPPLPSPKRKAERPKRLPPQGTVSYGDSVKSKAIDLVKATGQKQQIKLTLKKQGPAKPIDKTVLGDEDDSGESDTDARILKKRKVDTTPPSAPPAKVSKQAVIPVPTSPALASLTSLMGGAVKKPSAARREELLKQLRAVEDAIARKRSKPLG